MNGTVNDESDLGQEIAALVCGGCEIRIAPHQSPLGILHADVLIMPPSTTQPRSTADELNRVTTGEPASHPVRVRFHLIYEIDSLAAQLHEARRFLLG